MMILVMQKSGKSYVQLGRYSISNYRINGEPAVPAKGSSDWSVIDGDVQSIEVTSRGRSFIKLYRRVDGASERLPETIPADGAERDDDGDIVSIAGHDPRFYEAEYEVPPDEWVQAEFEVIDRDCEPVDMPSWCVVDWPANIEHYRERQHLYPCHITVESLFCLCAEQIESAVNKSSGRLFLADYRSIGTLHVDALVDIPEEFQRPERVEYYKTFRAKKASTKIVKNSTKTVRLFELNGHYSKPSASCIQVPSIRAANYEKLASEVEKYVDSIVGLCDMGRRCVCPKCGGNGVVFTEKRT
jgi:hypothetical protein